MKTTPPGELSRNDIRKILTGAAIAAVGAAAAVGMTWLATDDIDLGTAGMAAFAAFCSVLANASRKLLTTTRE